MVPIDRLFSTGDFAQCATRRARLAVSHEIAWQNLPEPRSRVLLRIMCWVKSIRLLLNACYFGFIGKYQVLHKGGSLHSNLALAMVDRPPHVDEHNHIGFSLTSDTLPSLSTTISLITPEELWVMVCDNLQRPLSFLKSIKVASSRPTYALTNLECHRY